MKRDTILRPGVNCWRIAQARRAAVLIDAEAYFQALRRTLARAKRSIFIIGWDVDDQLHLPGGPPDDDLPQALGEFLDALTASRPALEVFILIWDFASLYADVSDWLPIFRANWKTHGRLRFHLDGRHPPGATQHQRLVVVDDDVAFCGGLDLRRPQDTDAERHDVQAMIQGIPARALGELARERWRRATGEAMNHAPPEAADAWPEDVAADFERIEAGLARTEPAYDARESVREIEHLYADAIGAARCAIYIENHYLTAPGVADALAARLREPDGPAIVVILPRATHGWLAENEIGVRQAYLIRRLRDSDEHGRLRACYPHNGDDAQTEVRGKVLIVDDRLLSVGSANLSQRSMRLDAELNIALEAGTQEARTAIESIRMRLLRGHTGNGIATGPSLAGMHDGTTLLRFVDEHAGRERGLRPLEAVAAIPTAETLPSGFETRPEHPVDAERLSRMLVPPAPRSWIGFGVAGATLLALFAALAVAWQWTPLSEWLNVENLAAHVTAYQDHPLALLLVVAAYVAGGLLVAPITVLVVVTVLVFGTGKGIVYALIGSLASASAVYGLGHSMGRESIRRLAGVRLNRISRALARRGVLASVLVRWLPLAPFSIVNLVAGASHIRFGHYFLGSTIGIFVDIVFIAVFMRQLQAALREPGWTSIGIIVALLVVAGCAALGLRAWLRRQRL
ncbi:MAG: VTT domain-containing protein [Gammaproteobacteria bacterium]